jgi:hypothetical protein
VISTTGYRVRDNVDATVAKLVTNGKNCDRLYGVRGDSGGSGVSDGVEGAVDTPS